MKVTVQSLFLCFTYIILTNVSFQAIMHVPEISIFHLSKKTICSNASVTLSERVKMAVWRKWKEIGVFSLNFHSETDIPTSFRIISFPQDLLKCIFFFKSKDQKYLQFYPEDSDIAIMN